MKSFRKFLLEDVPNKEMGQFYQNMINMQTDPNFNKILSNIKTRNLASPLTNLFPAFGKLIKSPEKLPASTMNHISIDPETKIQIVRQKGVHPAIIPQNNPKNLIMGLAFDPSGKIPGNLSIIDPIAMAKDKITKNPRKLMSNFAAHEISHNFQTDRMREAEQLYHPRGDSTKKYPYGKPTSYDQWYRDQSMMTHEGWKDAIDAKARGDVSADALYRKAVHRYITDPTEVSARIHGAVGSAAAHTYSTGRPPSFEQFVKDAESADNTKKTMDRLKKTYGRVIQSWQDVSGERFNPDLSITDGGKPLDLKSTTKATKTVGGTALKGLGVAGAIADPAGTAFQTAADAIGGRFAGALGGGLGAALFINQSAGDPEGDIVAHMTPEQTKEYNERKRQEMLARQEQEKRQKEIDKMNAPIRNPQMGGPVNKPKM